MAESTHRRTTSEQDMSSMRRISDALLLAQNRARRATDRANQTEHVLRLVLAQVDVPNLRVNSLAEWELLRTILTSNPGFIKPRPPFREEDAAIAVSSSSCLKTVATDVVANLNMAMTRQKHYVEHLPTLYFSRWSHKIEDAFGPVYFVAGLLAGIVVGVVLTKQWHLQFIHTQQQAPSLFSKLAKWCSRRAPVAGTPWHYLIPMPMDEYNYRMHPATTVEVV